MTSVSAQPQTTFPSCPPAAYALAEDPGPEPETATTARFHRLIQARQQFDRFTVKRPDPALKRDLAHGWMLPLLLHMDDCLWGRWDYWASCYEGPQLPEQPIPPIELLPFPHAATRKMLEASLDCIPQHGSWQTWGGWGYVDFFFSWLLFGLGHKGQSELPPEPTGCAGASGRLFQVYCLDAMLLWPHDYFGSLLAESSYGKSQGFYPTPHHICEFIARMLCDDGRDMRTETVCDPCVGTGRMLLHASNHSLRLYGMEIDATLCKATLANGYLYMPWAVRPIPWLDPALAALERIAEDTNLGQEVAAPLSDRMAEAAPPQAHAYLAETEHDAAGQAQVAPLLKRRRRPTRAQPTVDPTQGSLF
jgi:N-6 DNA Methylase